MGRIKSSLIKRASRQLIEKENSLTGSFEDNKKILGNTMPSKKMRNKIAGYVARLIKAKQAEAKRLESKPSIVAP
jgi:small subunit ribosomal protein S17e